MKDYILVFVAVILLAISFVFSKFYQKRAGADPEAVFFSCSVSSLLSVSVLFLLCGCRVEATWFSLLMAALSNVFSTSYSLVGFRMMKEGKMATYTLFLMSGGMVVPYVVGIFALGEPVTAARILGLAAIVGGVVCANRTGERMERHIWKLGILVFFLNGMVSVVSKLHQIESGLETVSTVPFMLLNSLCGFALGITGFLICRKRQTERRERKLVLCVIPIILAAGLTGLASSFLQLEGARNLPATVLYPIITGGNIILTALAGRFVFKEALTKRMVVGILLCFIGTLLFL